MYICNCAMYVMEDWTIELLPDIVYIIKIIGMNVVDNLNSV
jgi:hypothetical protein